MNDELNDDQQPTLPSAEEDSSTENTQETPTSGAVVSGGVSKTANLKDKLFGNKKVLIGGALAFVLLAGGGAFYFTRSGGNGDTGESNVARQSRPISASISYVEGSVDKKVGESYEPLKVDDTLAEGDVIRTSGVASRATIALENGSFTRLGGDTEVAITSLRSDEVVITQDNGQVYSRVSPSSGGNYVVETSTSTFKALGTAFKTTTGGDEESVEVYDSKVEEVTTEKEVNQGEKLYVKNTQDTAKEGTVEALDIELVKADSFVSWNRTEDEKVEEFKDKLGFLKDVTVPELTLTAPANGSTVTVSSSSNIGSVVFKGKTEVGATVTVQSLSTAGAAPVGVEVGADGSFESGAISGPVGTAKFEVIAKDAAGNKNKLQVSVTFRRQSTSTGTSGITLSYGGLIQEEYRFAWTVGTNFEDAEGFKLVWNKTGAPTFDQDSSQYISDPSERQTSLSKAGLIAGSTYYVRVCRYVAGSCDTYSNQVTFVVTE